MDDLYTVRRHLGSPNQPSAFLVRGDNLSDALGAARDVVLGKAPSGSLASNSKRKGKPSQTIWAVVFLGGSNSEPPEWVIDSSTVRGNRLKVTYVRNEAVRDLAVEYLYFIRLGDMPKGKCFIEIYDRFETEADLVQKVVVD